MMKKILKTIVAFSLGLSVMIGVNGDVIKADSNNGLNLGPYEYATGDFVRVMYKGEEMYLPIRITTYDSHDGSRKSESTYTVKAYGVDYGTLEGLLLFHYNTVDQIIANDDNGIIIPYAYVYGIDNNSNQVLDGAIIYSISSDTNVNGNDPSNRDKRPNATLEKYDFNEMVIYDWYSMGNYVRKE